MIRRKSEKKTEKIYFNDYSLFAVTIGGITAWASTATASAIVNGATSGSYVSGSVAIASNPLVRPWSASATATTGMSCPGYSVGNGNNSQSLHSAVHFQAGTGLQGPISGSTTAKKATIYVWSGTSANQKYENVTAANRSSAVAQL